MSRLEWRPVIIGAVIAGVLATAAATIYGRVVEGESNSGFAVLAVVAVVMAVGGYVAARPQTELAFTSGGTAAFLGSVVAQILSLIARLAQGKSFPAGYAIGFIFTLLISTSFGVLGGFIALRLDRQRDSHEEAST